MQQCVREVLLPGDIAMSAVFIDMLKSHWNDSHWPSPTCTASVLPPFTNKSSKVIRGLLFGVCVL